MKWRVLETYHPAYFVNQSGIFSEHLTNSFWTNKKFVFFFKTAQTEKILRKKIGDTNW